MPGVIDQILQARGLADAKARTVFCNPDFTASKYDPFLLPDMAPAVDRLVRAKQNNELVCIYGDYDIDGLTATTLLLDAFASFGIRCQSFIPNRFVDGYGLSKNGIQELHKKGAQVVVTVDCGSLSHGEIDLANSLGMDVIITDHHSVADTMPNAVATINPKRSDHSYPFIDLAGVGVAFKLVQAMQQKIDGLPMGQEKWLLDLVALGTVCDVVQLIDENRANVYWGLQVLGKTRRPGIRALAQVAGQAQPLTARSLGFGLGPRLNAAGRMETAQLALELLTTTDGLRAVEIAYQLDVLNQNRRTEQDRITKMALEQAARFKDDPVLVLSHETWSHGIIGIVAAKVLEAMGKPTFVLQEIGEHSKGSARSFGDFSAVDATNASRDWLVRGGGHKFAAGVTLKTEHIPQFRQAINDFYKTKNFQDQLRHLQPSVDATVDDIRDLNHELMNFLKTLEPFGNGNPEPILHLPRVVITGRRALGKDQTHLKLQVADRHDGIWELIGFGMAMDHPQPIGAEVSVWFKLLQNEWRGVTRLEGQLVKLDFAA